MSALLVVLSSLASGGAPAVALPPSAEAAIVRAVQARLGPEAAVVIGAAEGLAADGLVTAADAIEDAVIEPGAAFGRPIRMLLRAPVERGGVPVLTPVARVAVRVDVSVEHWHTTHAVTRGSRLADGDVRRVRHQITSGPLAPPASEAEVEGAAVLRDVPADGCLTASVVLPRPAVKAGDRVAAIVRLGMVEARAAVIAIDAGRVGATVRVRHPETKRTLAARVIGRGAVEVETKR